MRLTRMLLAAFVVLLLPVVSAVAQTWSVQSATYGAGTKQQDVTAAVRQLVTGPNFQVSNKDLGIDPAPGQDKTLRIVARDAKGNARTFTYAERQMVDTRMFGGTGTTGSPVVVGGNGNGLRILHAAYRQSGGTQFTDVTLRLQAMVKNNQLQMVVNDKNLGTTLAPGKPKELVVRYQYGDRIYIETVKENGELILPSTNKAKGMPAQ